MAAALEDLPANASVIQQANYAFLRGKYSDAIKLYNKVLEVNPRDTSSLLNRAAASLQLELYKHVLRDTDAALAVEPLSLRAHQLKGRALAALNRREEAQQVWRAGLRILQGDAEQLLVLRNLLYGSSAGPAISSTVEPTVTPTTSLAVPATPITTVPASVPQGGSPAVTPLASSSSFSTSGAAAEAEAKSPEPVTPSIQTPTPTSPAASPPAVPSNQTPGTTASPASPTTPPPKEKESLVASRPATPPSAPIPSIELASSKVASQMVAARGLIQHGVGNIHVDEKIAFGYLQVNTGNFAAGIKLFSELLQSNPKVIAAYLGRGTAYALSGELDKAINDFSSAIVLDSKCVEAWKRRGQTRSARGLDQEALADLTFALKLAPTDQECLHQRGLIYYKLRNYRRAIVDFKAAAEAPLPPGGDGVHVKLSLNHLGLCLNTIGQPWEAIEAHKKALALDPGFKEAWSNIGQAYKELGMLAEAEQNFTKALELDPKYAQALQLRGFLRHGAGWHREALEDLRAALQLEPHNKDCRHIAGVILHDLGQFRAAIQEYSILLRAKPDHVVWYLRELALYMHHHLDRPVREFNMDADLHPGFKEGECKRSSPSLLEHYNNQRDVNASIPDLDLNDIMLSPEQLALLKAALVLGPRLQYSTPGFLPNKRQHVSFGLAILEIAQTVREVWKAGGKYTYKAASSDRQAANPRQFGWRDAFDIAVRWRQVSEINDPVWFVDQLSPEQFAEGFGSHTPMVTQQTEVVRYSPFAPRAIRIMKEIIQEHCPHLRDDVKEAVMAAKDWKELHAAMKRDFWIITPCASTARPGVKMEGTRLTIQTINPEGFEFSIRTPGTPPRWVEFDHELTHIWNLLTQAVCVPQRDMDRISDLILHLAFYWYNFMPLSRGTAAVGYMTMIGLFLSLDYEIAVATPPNTQVDWEAILGPSPAAFIKECVTLLQTISPWLYPARTLSTILKNLPLVSTHINTFRQMIKVLNVGTAST